MFLAFVLAICPNSCCMVHQDFQTICSRRDRMRTSSMRFSAPPRGRGGAGRGGRGERQRAVLAGLGGVGYCQSRRGQAQVYSVLRCRRRRERTMWRATMSAAAAVAPATVSATAYGQQRSPTAQPRASGARRGAGRVGWGGGRGGC